jgi:hypothetical protein
MVQRRAQKKSLALKFVPADLQDDTERLDDQHPGEHGKQPLQS